MTVAGAAARVAEVYAAIAAADRPEVWITLRAEADVAAELAEVLAGAATSSEPLPLAGLVFAVKDNIDVAGLPTTAACPGFAHPADTDATAVARLRAVGAVVLGKTNLDQFATGLVGTRSPYGAVRSAQHPDRISGGSSSGSAVAVALGLVDFALGTDTAGSGRVPAALQGIVGVKGTVGLVPTTGVLPACRTLDCVTVFAAGLDLAESVLRVIAGPDGRDALAVAVPASAPLAAPASPVLAVPRPADLAALAPLWRAAFDTHLGRLRDAGVTLVEIDISPFLAAAALLYNGAFVAERYAAVGEIIAAGPEGLDPVVAGIVTAAGELPAHRYAADVVRLAELKLAGELAFAGADAMLLPTTTHHPTLAEVAAEPVTVNSRLGTFTNFANLFGYPAYAVPIDAGVPGENVGVQVLARPFADAVARDVAALLLRVDLLSRERANVPLNAVDGELSPISRGELSRERSNGHLSASEAAITPLSRDVLSRDRVTREHVGEQSVPGHRVSTDHDRGVHLLVVGAHLSGLPLHDRMRRHGALFAGDVRTATGYTLVALGDALNRPGMVRTPGTDTSVLGELWRVPETALSALLLEVAPPLGLGRVTLFDGREVIGYLCEATAATGKTVVADGDWRAHVSGAAATAGAAPTTGAAATAGAAPTTGSIRA
ncbi:allophanate hydrolase [Cryobacterium sp. SO2]|uniref:allophanate hydrolase n=1 Tax=Cryobacterium sp. SO2 TaxID=1897060 RepID=UPI00223D0F23|nr:allophanate hydrolase [Cryobacterium sp. SO2]WEO76361.1 allophanate hydrolase [Cryobacterium sp. SO2]